MFADTSVAGFVLAGGRGRRMGCDKALLVYENTTLVQHALTTLQSVCEDVTVAGSRKDLCGLARIVPDEFADCGPLAGIHAALKQSKNDWNLFLAVDLPRVAPEHLTRLLDQRKLGIRGVVAQADGRMQPLCALYHRDLAAPIERALQDGKHAVIPVVESVCGRGGLIAIELGAGILANLNTPAEVAALASR